MSVRPEEDPGYFDEFVSEDVRKQLHTPKPATVKDTNPEAEKDVFEDTEEFVHPDDA